ncbi:Mur ligase [Halorubrum sp. HHNYT27]|uniref:Mur ligase n=1 Tax=Halorubrum sp. HHNYT27 TaxID=3402275 RepID=UPI003EBDA4F7
MWPFNRKEGLSYGGTTIDQPSTLERAQNLIGRGRTHQAHLEDVDIRIGVSGIRGKSSTAKRLGSILTERGYDTYTKITGDHPTSYYNGRKILIQRRGPRVTLYENVNLIQEFVPQLTATDPENAIVMENQAITEYTMRMVNERYLRPNLLLFCNVRQDHNDTLGETRQEIARSFARSVPEGCHVISGEQHGAIHDYLEDEIEARGGTIEQVDVPERHRHLTGAETVHMLNHVLDHIGESRIADDEIQSMLDTIQPEWTDLPKGRVFNAAKVNEIESTELFRRQLAGTGDDAKLVCPFVFLRRDRRGRTSSFVDYIDILFERGLIDRVHVGGTYTGVFARRVEAPATEHDTDETDAETVLDRLFATDQPVMFMANTVDPFMRKLADEVETRERGGKPMELPKY